MPALARFFLMTSLLSLSSQSRAAAFTLDEIYQKAAARSESLGLARLDISKQESAIESVESRRRSRVRLQAGVNAVTSKTVDRDWKQDVAPDLLTEWRYPLYDGGATRSQIESERRLRDALSWDLADQREQLFLECARLFYEILGAEKDATNLNESLTVYRDREQTLSRRAKIGRSRTAEVLAARTQLQLLRSQLAQAEKDLHLAQQRLSWLADLQLPLQLRDTLTMEQMQPRELPVRTAPLPTVEAAKARVQAAEGSIETAKAATRPQLDFVAAHRWSYPQDVNTQQLSIGLGLNWLLYDAGQVSATVSSFSIERQQAALRQELLQREAGLEQSLARREWQDGLAQLRDLEQALQAAQQNVKVQQQEFENGLLTNLEVMQALDTRLQVKRSIDQTIFRTKLVYLESRLRAGLLNVSPAATPAARNPS